MELERASTPLDSNKRTWLSQETGKTSIPCVSQVLFEFYVVFCSLFISFFDSLSFVRSVDEIKHIVNIVSLFLNLISKFSEQFVLKNFLFCK
jgi:hypothetical protein